MKKSIFTVFVALCSCVSPVSMLVPLDHGSSDDSGGETGAASTGVVASTGGSTDANASSTAADPGSESDSSGTCTFIGCGEDTTGVDDPLLDCDTFSQNCPDGMKCTTTYELDWGDSRNRCVDVHPQPHAVGEPCQQFGELGIDGDDCVFGSLCWDPDPVTGIGMCVELCGGTQEAPACATPGTFCATGKSLQLCLQSCDPREADACPVGCTCISNPNGTGFMCVLDASGDEGEYADECQFANACDPGLACLESTASPDCDPQLPGCCMPVCDTTAPVCPPGLACLPWYEPGQVPQGYETLGYCSVAP
jgi:hypothetical protein